MFFLTEQKLHIDIEKDIEYFKYENKFKYKLLFLNIF